VDAVDSGLHPAGWGGLLEWFSSEPALAGESLVERLAASEETHAQAGSIRPYPPSVRR
jgi:hypothetical protein